MNKNRKVIGTLVPVSSLYSLTLQKDDQGNFEAGAIFLDWIKKNHQSAWQMLPLHESQLEEGSFVKHSASPYKCYGIGLSEKYLSISHSQIYPSESQMKKFMLRNKFWIEDYSLFCALRNFFKTDDWREWDTGLRNRKKETLDVWRKKLSKEIEGVVVTQWQLYNSYEQLRTKAKALGIYLIGDLPFYLSIKSPLVWAHQEAFLLENGVMKMVSGIPNSKHTYYGRQLWGHPLYKWEDKNSRSKIIKLWEIRLEYLSKLFDIIRFDHAKGFYDYGALNLENPEKDLYLAGPGRDVFEELVVYCRKIKLLIFAEDTGDKLFGLRESLKNFKIPGIKIFRFAYDEKKKMIIDHYAKVDDYASNTIVYSTTHDTETLLEYLNSLSVLEKKKLAMVARIKYLKDDKVFSKSILQKLIKSQSKTIIIPIQDWLQIKDRINIPGTEKETNDLNWQFKLKIPIEELPNI